MGGLSESLVIDKGKWKGVLERAGNELSARFCYAAKTFLFNFQKKKIKKK